MTLVFADDGFVQGLNNTFRQKNTPTNVLSFPNAGPYADPSVLGDVVLSYETILAESEQQPQPTTHHCLHRVLHGIFPLLAYDHETDDAAAIMEAKERDALNLLGIPDPYFGSVCLNH